MKGVESLETELSAKPEQDAGGSLKVRTRKAIEARSNGIVSTPFTLKRNEVEKLIRAQEQITCLLERYGQHHAVISVSLVTYSPRRGPVLSQSPLRTLPNNMKS